MSPEKKYNYLDKSRAERLLEERRQIEKNRKKFTQVSGFSYANIEDWENGRRDFPVALLSKLYEMGADVGYILSGERSNTGNVKNVGNLDKRIEELEERVSELKNHLADKEEIISLQRKQLESISDNRDPSKIASEAADILKQKRNDLSSNESAG